METLSTNLGFGGVQGVYRHAASATGTDMTFSVYVPPHADGAKLPVLMSSRAESVEDKLYSIALASIVR